MSDVFIPADEFEPASATPGVQQANANFIPEDQFESYEDHYGSAGQMAKTALEGLAKGAIGAAAPFIETKFLGVEPEDIKAREEVNPLLHGGFEAAGLAGPLILSGGMSAEARAALEAGQITKEVAHGTSALAQAMQHGTLPGLMTKAGQVATEALGLANAAKEASLGFKVGSSAVQQAAEMAVLQGSDEVAKRVLQDPNTSAESAIANIGLAAALGGAGGAAFTGVISPLWSATAGPKVEGLLKGLTERINGTAGALPAAAEDAAKTLGIEPGPVIRAAMSDNPKAKEAFSILKEAGNKDVLENINRVHREAADSVANALGITPTDLVSYSENEAGHELRNTFNKEFQAKYAPLAERMAQRDAKAATIAIGDEARLDHYGKLIEKAIENVGTDSPYYKLYDEYGQRLLAKDTIGGIDKLKTEIGNRIRGLRVGGDHNVINALQDIRNSLTDLQENQISRAALEYESAGLKNAVKEGESLLAERQAANADYSKFAKMSDELMSHLSVGDFRGAGSLQARIADIAPEDLLKKFSIRGNADFIPFLKEHFPETLAKVQESELKRFVKPAVLAAKEDLPLNIKKLSDMIEKGMLGQKEYIQSIVPENALKAIEAAKTLTDGIPNLKSSGTAGHMARLFKNLPMSAMAAIGFLAHGASGGLFGGLLGETAQLMGRNIPDSMRLAYLKFIGSNQPIKSEAFKAMVDFFHATYKADNMFSKAAKGVFTGGSQVLAKNIIPDQDDLDKLDQKVQKGIDFPEQMLKAQMNSDVGHYLPSHQTALAEASTKALNYLQSIKPKPFQASPLDKPIEPSEAQKARYNRALTIAQQPAIILQHIKDGTLQQSDIQDLNAMYPQLYTQFSNRLSQQLNSAQANEELIPYKTKMALSLFMGQPLDSSMQPGSIQAAQPKPKPPAPNQANPAKGGRPSAMKTKNANAYRTTGQAAEADRSNRE